MIFKTYIYSILALENEILVYLSGNILSVYFTDIRSLMFSSISLKILSMSMWLS